MNDMSDQDKSVLLAKAMGLEISNHPVHDSDILLINIPKGWGYEWELVYDFYDLTLMGLAWRVLNWATSLEGPFSTAVEIGDFSLEDWLFRHPIWRLADAQRLWLDKVLELAIEAGLIEVE